MHDCFYTRQLELDRDANGLIAAVAEKPDAPVLGPASASTYAASTCLTKNDFKAYFTFGVTSSPKICIWSKSSCTELAAK